MAVLLNQFGLKPLNRFTEVFGLLWLLHIKHKRLFASLSAWTLLKNPKFCSFHEIFIVFLSALQLLNHQCSRSDAEAGGSDSPDVKGFRDCSWKCNVYDSDFYVFLFMQALLELSRTRSGVHVVTLGECAQPLLTLPTFKGLVLISQCCPKIVSIHVSPSAAMLPVIGSVQRNSSSSFFCSFLEAGACWKRTNCSSRGFLRVSTWVVLA